MNAKTIEERLMGSKIFSYAEVSPYRKLQRETIYFYNEKEGKVVMSPICFYTARQKLTK